MNGKTFTYSRNIRTQKATIVRLFSKPIVTLLKFASVVFLVAGVAMLIIGMKVGYVLFAPAIWAFMFLLWHQWDLVDLDAGNPVASASTRLEELLSADIVNRIGKADTSLHLWEAIRDHWQARFFVNRFLIPTEVIEQGLQANPVDVEVVYAKAFELAAQTSQDHMTAGSITAALLLTCPYFEAGFARMKISTDDLTSGLYWQRQIIDRYFKRKERNLFGGLARDWANGYTPVLDKFGENISKSIEAGYSMFSDETREDVITQMIQIISRPSRNGVALVAPVGSGKSSLVYALAETMLKGDDKAGGLAYLQVVKLDANRITSTIGQGLSIERLMEEIFYDALHAQNIILFLDEAQLFMETAPGSIDISHIIMQVLEQTRMPIILALSPEDWHKFSITKSALLAQLTKIDLPELNESQVARILEDIALPLESRAQTMITYSAIKETYAMASRYVTDKAFPAKGIDVLQDALNYPDQGIITENSVKMAVEKTTGAKVTQASQVERGELLNLEELIHRRMINQFHAVKTVSEALRRSRAGVRDPKRPVGSFLFLGPTGVGKTELARSLAATYFSGEESMIRLDMSEYQLATDVARILEATTDSSVGSTFLRDVATKPFSVVLLDEIEKAHPDILNLLLQMLDEGTLTDTSGRVVSFKEAIIIVTSNAGADEIRRRIEAGQQLEAFEDEFVDQLINAKIFKPELMNRFDDIVLFRPLKPDELMQVVQIMVGNLNKTLSAQNISVELTADALQMIVQVGYDPRLGARPMRRALQKYVENTLSRKILTGEAQPGARLTLSAADLQSGSGADSDSGY
ncbi:AAA family ATPase [bacterium]|nr:AAA family ATPase [bacterium]